MGGQPQYEKEFYEEGSRLTEAMRTTFGVPGDQVTFLAENPALDSLHINGKSTKEEVERAFARISKKAVPGDMVFVVLIGHGTSGGDQSRINLPGPDLSATDFAALLKPLAAQRVAFVNAASASGDFLSPLSGKNRVVVTATKSGFQNYPVKFSKYFAAAYAGTTSGVDTNNDGNVSILEAFLYTSVAVTRDYDRAKLLQPEHPRIDDNGDREGTDAPRAEAPDSADGRLAASLALAKKGK